MLTLFSIIALAIGLWLIWAVYQDMKLAKRIGSAGIGLLVYGAIGVVLTIVGVIGFSTILI